MQRETKSFFQMLDESQSRHWQERQNRLTQEKRDTSQRVLDPLGIAWITPQIRLQAAPSPGLCNSYRRFKQYQAKETPENMKTESIRHESTKYQTTKPNETTPQAPVTPPPRWSVKDFDPSFARRLRQLNHLAKLCDVAQVSNHFDPKDVKTTYRALLKRLHPDRNPKTQGRAMNLAIRLYRELEDHLKQKAQKES